MSGVLLHICVQEACAKSGTEIVNCKVTRGMMNWPLTVQCFLQFVLFSVSSVCYAYVS
jgi:hypothetical protein